MEALSLYFQISKNQSFNKFQRSNNQLQNLEKYPGKSSILGPFQENIFSVKNPYNSRITGGSIMIIKRITSQNNIRLNRIIFLVDSSLNLTSKTAKVRVMCAILPFSAARDAAT